MAKTRRTYTGGAASTTTSSSIASSGTTSFTITAYTGWPYGSDPFFVVVEPGTANEEKMLVVRSGSTDTTLTVYSTPSVAANRGMDGTSAAAHTSGATIYPVFTALDADEANELASTLTTKGDLLAHDAASFERLAVGTNDYVLMADSGEATGLKWGQVDTATLVDGAVETAKINDLAVTGSKLANATVDTKTASYTLVTADRNKRVVMNSASATTITVNDSVFAAGDVVWVHNIGAGDCTITAGTATVNTAGSLELAQWGGGALYFTSASTGIFFPAGGAGSTLSVDYIVVGGGGGGSSSQNAVYASGFIAGGGGGAGGYLTGSIDLAYDVSHPVVVGDGGASGKQNVQGDSGCDSVLATLVAHGGGGGGKASAAGLTGGSGGGGGESSSGGAAISGQGSAGGTGTSDDAGGGGGAAAAGTKAGGAGTYQSWLTDALGSTLGVGQSSGGERYFSGGGGGAKGGSASANSGGVGGGAAGAASTTGGNHDGASATANTGGGGGGGLCWDSYFVGYGGAGGSGAVVIRYLTADGTLTVGSNVNSTTTTDGSYTYVAFKSGADTISWAK